MSRGVGIRFSRDFPRGAGDGSDNSVAGRLVVKELNIALLACDQ